MLNSRMVFRLVNLGFSLLLCLSVSRAHSGPVVTATLGANSASGFQDAHFASSLGLYAIFDNQTLIGVQTGQGTIAGSNSIPIAADAMIRLPLGRIVLPVVTGSIGVAVGHKDPDFLWRGGGGFDIKNGRRSSLLLLGAYERLGSLSGWLGRAGFLLEL